jgi:hypothetical protein
MNIEYLINYIRDLHQQGGRISVGDWRLMELLELLYKVKEKENVRN